MANWQIDSTHTLAAFTVRHMMISNVRSAFQKVSGMLTYDATNPNASSVEVVIPVASMATTGDEKRDQHLQSADFLDAATYPNITFKSTRVEVDADGVNGKVYGDLTIRDVTRPVVLNVEKLGESKSPWGQQVVGFTGNTKINREDFGLNWNVALETGGWLVAKEIKIELEVEAILVAEAETEGAAQA